MTTRTIRTAALVACAIAAAGTAAPASAEPPFSDAVVAGPESGGGRVIWASASGEGATLMTVDEQTGAPKVLGVLPLDEFTGTLEVGTDGAQRPVALYSGCRAGRCATFRYDFAKGRERELHLPRSPAGCRTRALAIDRGSLYLAYAARPDTRSCRAGVYKARQRSLRRVAAGREIVDLDVTGGRAVFWQATDNIHSQLALVDLRGPGRRTVVSVNDSPDADYTGYPNPTISRRHLTYGSYTSDGQGSYGAVIRRPLTDLGDSCERLTGLTFGGADGPLPDFDYDPVPAPLASHLYLSGADPTTRQHSLHRLTAPGWEEC